jgi:hypothetical protein
MEFRVDPVNENGIFDHDFYSSQEYTAEVEVLRKYLKLEGFDVKEGEFNISFNKRTWLCKPVKTKK